MDSVSATGTSATVTGLNSGTEYFFRVVASYGRQLGSSCNTSSNASLARTVTVGSFAANAFGLHDMHGNAAEWVEDCYFNTYTGAPSDGSARTSCGGSTLPILRGGSWVSTSQNLRSAGRFAAAFGINMLLLLAAGWVLAYGGVFFLGFGALTDQVALELAEGAEYMEGEPPA